MKTYLVIETSDHVGKMAYVKIVTNNDNILKHNDKKIVSVSPYRTWKSASERADFLNELYKRQGR